MTTDDIPVLGVPRGTSGAIQRGGGSNKRGRNFKLTPELAALMPPASTFGPAMKALNERQRLFVVALLYQGSKQDASRAARVAGYDNGSGGALRVQAFRLMHDEKVQAAIQEEARKRIQAGTAAAAGVLLEVMEDENAAANHRLKAAEMVLDRGGIHATSEQRVTLGYAPTREEKLMRIIELARAMGQDPRVLLGSIAETVEADFKLLEAKIVGQDAGATSVEPPTSAAPVPTTDDDAGA